MTTTVSGALVATAPVFTYTERLALGLVHLLYLAPGVPEFSIDWSWLLAASVRRPVALALMAATVAGFALVALAVRGMPGLSGVSPASPSGPACCRWPCSPRSGTPYW